jgi:drug/metabolite transporter (DMT)-like permease
MWLALDNQPPTRLTLVRMVVALPAIVLLSQNHAQLTSAQSNSPEYFIGVIEMLIASALYALHLPINQRVLYDMPAPTVTLYTLIAMSAVVVPVFLFAAAVPFTAALTTPGTLQTAETVSGASFLLSTLGRYASPMVGLTLVTFFSRLTLFLGVKNLGGMQTALLGLSEVLVTVIVAHVWLGERFSGLQWLGAVLLVVSLGLVGLEKAQPRKGESGGFLSWLRPVGGSTDSWGSHE